jgi:hypothetical protein
MKANGQSPVLCILPRGEAIRNFAYTGALQMLQDRVGCTALAVKPSEEIWQHLAKQCSDLQVLKEFRDGYPVRLLREVLDVAHGRWLWSEAAQERWRLRDLEAVTVSQKLKRWGKKAAVRPFASRAGLNLLSGTERKASRFLRPNNHYLDLFRKLKPSLVFNGSHVHSANAIQPVQAAQWLGIPTATFIFSWDNLTSQGRVMPPYAYYLVWNEAIKQQLLGIYEFVRPEQVFVTGTPQFDPHFQKDSYWSRERFCQEVGADPARPIVLYATGMPNHMPGEDELVEQIAGLLSPMKQFGSPQLLVRVYAKDRSGRFEPLKKRRPDILFPEVPWEPNWLTPKPADLPLWTNTLRHSALGINVASTVSLELCMFDKPVINVGYNPPSVPTREMEYLRYYSFDHYRPVVESGAVQVAKTRDELRQLIVRAFEQPAEHAVNRGRLLKQMFGETLDGRSAHRAAEVLIGLANATTNGKKLSFWPGGELQQTGTERNGEISRP